MQKKTGCRVLILGGGRWGQITFNNLNSLNSVSELKIISRTLDIKNSIIDCKNFKIKKNINFKEIKKYNLIVICKNNISKFQFFKKIKHLKSIIVIEKPFIIKRNIKNFLYSFKKGKFFISLPWFFERKLKKIFHYLIFSKKIDRVNFFWYDQVDKKYGLKKKFDKDIYYTEDIFPHIFSILYEKTYKTNIINFSSFNIENKIESLKFNFNTTKVDLKCSNKTYRSYKKIVFFKGKKKVFEIKISDKYFFIKDVIKKKNIKIKNKSDNLIKQYKYLINFENLNEYKHTCYQQILYQSHLNKLCKKFQP